MRTAKEFLDLVPTAREVAAVHNFSGVTVNQMAAAIYTTRRTYLKYKSGDLPMPPALWELMNIKANQFANQKRVVSVS